MANPKKVISALIVLSFFLTSSIPSFSLTPAHSQDQIKKKLIKNVRKNSTKLSTVESKNKSLDRASSPKSPLTKGLSSFEASSGKGSVAPDVCETAEPKGMTSSFKKCSLDCKTVCSYKTSVDGVACFACQQGGDDMCKDIGAFEADHDWCKPGGICHKDPMLYCTPFDAVGPRRSKLKCTNCKKRPDMCWQKVKDGTTTYTNCMLGCWDGTCVYEGKYKEKEWDGSDDIIHCYKCVTPPPPPTCEDMKWGYDWESDCLNSCQKPGYCQEFEFEVGKKNPKACVDVDTSVKKGKKEDDDKGGTRTRGGGGGGGVKPPKLPGGINDASTPHGPNETGDGTKTKPKSPCEEVAASLAQSGVGVTPLREDEIKNQKRDMERFRGSLEKLKERAKKIEEYLKGRRAEVAKLEKQLKSAESDVKEAQEEVDAPRSGTYEETILKNAKAKAAGLGSHHNKAKLGLKNEIKSFSKDINTLKAQAMKDLYRADSKAKQAEELARVDRYDEAYRDLSRLEQMREISDKVFDQKVKDLKSKVADGGDKAEGYQKKLDNLNRGRKEWEAGYDRRERYLKKLINSMRKQNGEDGVGPYDQRGLRRGVGNAANLIYQQINKIKSLRRALAKAAKNNCPPKGVDKIVKDLDKKLKELETLEKNLEDRYRALENGYPISDKEKKSIEESIKRMAEGSKRTSGPRSTASFFAESLGEEIERTITDPTVALSKAFWYTVGVVEGVGKAIKGLVDLGIGAVDLIGETAAKYMGYKDGGIFGTDASEALQKVLGGVDGNMNLDGLEKLAQGIDKAIDQKFKQLSRMSDENLDKAVARGTGNIVGETLVGDKVIGGVIKGAAKAYSATKLRKVKGVGAGGKTPNAPPPKLPDTDIPKISDGTPGTSTGGKLAGKADNAPKGPKTTPKEPRGPPTAAKALDNTKPLEKTNRKAKPLDDKTAANIEKTSGFRKDHAKNMHKFAQEHGTYLVVRNGNPDSVKYMNRSDTVPKPMSAKAKTAQVGPDLGLVVDPTHAKQAAYWDMALKKAAAKAVRTGDRTQLDKLKKSHKKALDSWNDYGAKMTDPKKGKFVVDKKTGRVLMKVKGADGKTALKAVHGDYDLHGVYKANPDGTVAGRVSFGSGEKIRKGGDALEDGAALRRQLNKAIDPNKNYVQHVGQDDWIPDPKYVPNKPPDPPVTIFMPDGSPPVKLKTRDQMKKFYEEKMGIKWEYPDPSAGGSKWEVPSFEFLEKIKWVYQSIENFKWVNNTAQSNYAFC